jgi:O-antigen ligase
MKKIERIFFFIISIFLFLRFIFDGIAYPIFNLIFTLSFFLLFLLFLFLKRFKIDITHSEILFLIFIVFSIISSFFSQIENSGVRFNAYILSYFCVSFLVSNIAKEKKKKIGFIILFLIIIFSVNIYGIYQRFWGFEETRKYFIEHKEILFKEYPEFLKDIYPTFMDRLQSNRIFSTFVYPNIYAAFLVSVTPFLFFIFLDKYMSYYLSYFSIFLFFLSFFCLILTESIGGLLIFIFISHILFLQIIFGEKRLKKILPFILSFEIILVVIGYHFRVLPHIHSLIDRFWYWKASLKIIKLRPILGIGPENFKYYFLKFKFPESLEARHAHNLFIEIFSENGLIGVISLFSFLIYIILNSFRKKEDKFLSVGIAYLLISFLLHNLIDFDFYDPSVGILFFFFGGINEKRYKIIREKLTKILLCFIIILCIFVSFKLIKFEISERLRINSLMVENIYEKLQMLEKAERWENKNFEVYIEKGDLFLNMWRLTGEEKDLNLCISNYNKALSLNPFLTKGYLKLANLYEMIQDYKMAENILLKLIEIYPNKKLYNIKIARFYKKIGEEEKFQYYYERSKKLKEVSIEEKILINEIEKWIELQR